MRQKSILHCLVLAGLVFFVHTSQALTTNWTNASGGNWSDPANWDNGVPSSFDSAYIALNGTYSVTVESADGAYFLIVGATSGSQTLIVNTYLSVYRASVLPRGILEVQGYYFVGWTLNVSGTLDVYGTIETSSYFENGVQIGVNSSGSVVGDAICHLYDGSTVTNGTLLNGFGLKVWGVSGHPSQIISDSSHVSLLWIFDYATLTVQGRLETYRLQNYSGGHVDVLPAAEIRNTSSTIGLDAIETDSSSSMTLYGGSTISSSPAAFAKTFVVDGLLIVVQDSADATTPAVVSMRTDTWNSSPNTRVILHGNLEVDSLWTYSDSLYIAAGCTLTVNPAVFESSARVGGSGTVDFAGGSSLVDGTWWFDGGFMLSGDAPTTYVSCSVDGFQSGLSSLNLTTNFVQIILHDTPTLNVDSLRQYGGIISGRLNVAQHYNWEWGRLRADDNADFTIESGVSLLVSGTHLKFLDSLDLIIEGSAVMQDSGLFHMLDTSVVNVAPTGILHVGPAFTMDSIGSLYNSGETEFDAQLSPIRIKVPVRNSTLARTPGTIEILSGSVTFGDGGSNGGAIELAVASEWIVDGDYVNSGTIMIADNSTLRVLGSFLNDTTGIISGNGTLDISQADTFVNLGTISPGLSPGRLVIVGDLIQQENAVLQMEMSGSDSADYDHLQVTGALQLGGVLRLVRLNNFIPEAGNPMPMIRASSWIGHFDHIAGTNLENGEFLDIHFGPDGMEIGVLAGLDAVIYSTASPDSIRLIWRSVTGASSYAIYSDDNSGGAFPFLQEVAAPDSTVILPAASLKHFYKVSARFD